MELYYLPKYDAIKLGDISGLHSDMLLDVVLQMGSEWVQYESRCRGGMM